MTSSLRPRLIGLLTSSCDPCLIDAAITAGMNYIWLDAEHTSLTPGDVTTVVRQVARTPVEILVRVPCTDYDTLVTYANAGIDEVVLPRVRSLAEIDQAWQSVRFPPEGIRPRQVVPATSWGTDFSAAVRVSVIIETVDAAAAIDSIAASGLVSSFWFGQKDLSDDFVHTRGSADGLPQYLAETVAALGESDVEFGWSVTDTADSDKIWRAGGSRCSLYWDQYLARHLSNVVAASKRAGE